MEHREPDKAESDDDGDDVDDARPEHVAVDDESDATSAAPPSTRPPLAPE